MKPEEILDIQDNEALIDESQINKIMSIVRYAVIGLVSTLYFKNIYTNVLTNEYVSSFLASYILGMIFSLSLFVGFVFYNVKQAGLEKKKKYVIPKFKRPFIILFIVYTIIQIFLYLNYILKNIGDGMINFTTLTLIIIAIGLIMITWREIVYLKRVFPNSR